jgi:hypothetical protein
MSVSKDMSMPFYSVVGGRPVCQQETWLVHEDVHQPQNLDTQVMQATAEKWPLPPAPCGSPIFNKANPFFRWAKMPQPLAPLPVQRVGQVIADFEKQTHSNPKRSCEVCRFIYIG